MNSQGKHKPFVSQEEKTFKNVFPSYVSSAIFSSDGSSPSPIWEENKESTKVCEDLQCKEEKKSNSRNESCQRVSDTKL